MSLYKLQPILSPSTEYHGVIRLADNTFIPMNSDNSDYKAYLAWVAEGNEPLPAE